MFRTFPFLLILGLVAIPYALASGSGGDSVARIDRVSFTERSDGKGVVVRLHMSGSADRIGEPVREGGSLVTLTVYGASIARSRDLDPPASPVRSYRVDELDGNVILRLELSQEVQSSAYPDRNSEDLLIGLETGIETPPIVEPATEPRSTTLEGQRWTLDTIVIDAGHGGRDTGAVGHNRIREKDIVLPVALKLGAYLEELLGVNVVYTRDSDEFIELKERGRIANEAGAKLFVSLHANAASSRQAHGTETFFLGMHKTEAAKSVMERENEVIRFESDQDHYEQFQGTALVRQVLAQSAYMRYSESLASEIQNQFEERVGRRNRGVKQAGFYVLWSASMPSILVELGFVTNPSEARFMTSDEGQVYLASAIFRSIRAFKSEYEKGLLPVASN